MSDRWLQIEIAKLKNATSKMRHDIGVERRDFEDREAKKLAKLEHFDRVIEKALLAFDAAKDSAKREAHKEVEMWKAKYKEALKNPAPVHDGPAPKDKVAIAKASTLSIFDSIIFAISNWSTDGQTAPDVELACQSVLFPLVYEEVMKGNSDYYIEKVPVSALEVVRRGREYVRDLRSTCDVLLSDERVWPEQAPFIQKWWINDALPLLYGARDDSWSSDSSLQLSEVLEWRDMPASRALHFPLIFDGMDLVERYADDIRNSTGLPEFTKQTLSTRIEP